MNNMPEGTSIRATPYENLRSNNQQVRVHMTAAPEDPHAHARLGPYYGQSTFNVNNIYGILIHRLCPSIHFLFTYCTVNKRNYSYLLSNILCNLVNDHIKPRYQYMQRCMISLVHERALGCDVKLYSSGNI